MNRIKNSLVALFGLLALIGLVAILNPGTTRGQGQGGGNQQPLPVRDVDNPARQPFQRALRAVPLQRLI
jgi:hypothetical protein